MSNECQTNVLLYVVYYIPRCQKVLTGSACCNKQLRVLLFEFNCYLTCVKVEGSRI